MIRKMLLIAMLVAAFIGCNRSKPGAGAAASAPAGKSPYQCSISGARQGTLPFVEGSFIAGAFSVRGGNQLSIGGNLYPPAGGFRVGQVYEVGNSQGSVGFWDHSDGKSLQWQAERGIGAEGSSMKLVFTSVEPSAMHGTLIAIMTPLTQTGASGTVTVECAF